MNLQGLTVIFALIVIPISLVLSAYIQTNIDTIVLQTSYDMKLSNATYDAIKSFQLNTLNSKYSSVSDSKMRDIEASINTFFNALATNLGLGGYNQNILKTYVPAMVYTLYDGYYIYSPYENTHAMRNDVTGTVNNTYIHGLKPYIYYTCRYKTSTIDVVVNFTLDNYIVVYGTIGSQYVTKGGYLINPNKLTINSTNVIYDGITIGKESLKEYLIINENGLQAPKEYTYVYDNGTKMYYDDSDRRWFRYVTTNYTKLKVGTTYDMQDSSAINYYKEANEFTMWVLNNLGGLKIENIQDSQMKTELLKSGNNKIFEVNNNNDPEVSGSEFNEHRRQVIQHSIQTNLTTSIANYNEHSQATGTTYNFKIPLITDEEWDKILNNVCVISFLQGMPIGNKYYNNYCIVSNDINKEYISPQSIEVIGGDNIHHIIGCSLLFEAPANMNMIGYSNMGFVRQTIELNDKTQYVYPHQNTLCYRCIVDAKSTYNLNDILGKSTDSGVSDRLQGISRNTNKYC